MYINTLFYNAYMTLRFFVVACLFSMAASAPAVKLNFRHMLQAETSTTPEPLQAEPPATLLPTPFCADLVYSRCGPCCISVAANPPFIIEDQNNSPDGFLYKFLERMKCVPPQSLDIMAICAY
jgi:hypothetical protein